MATRYGRRRTAFPEPLTIPGVGITLAVRDAAIAAGVVVGVLVTLVSARRLEGLSPWRVGGAIAIVVLAGLTLGRAHYVLAHLHDDDTLGSIAWNIAHIWWSHHTPGAILGVVVGAVVGARLLRLPLGKLADLLIPSGGIAYAVVRLGCLAHGCCYGKVCFLPWCFAWPRGTQAYDHHVELGFINERAAHSVSIHPLQLYFVGMSIGLAVLALVLYRRKRYDGEVAIAGLAWFSGWLAALEILRADHNYRTYLWGYPELMWAGLALLALALVLLVTFGQAARRHAPPAWTRRARTPERTSRLRCALLLSLLTATAGAAHATPGALDTPQAQTVIRDMLEDPRQVQALVTRARRHPGEVRTPLLLLAGHVELRRGRWTSAQEMFELAVRRGDDGPWTPLAYSGLGWVALGRGQTETAQRHFAAGPPAGPDRIVLGLLEGAAGQGDPGALESLAASGALPIELVDAAHLATGYVHLWASAPGAAADAFARVGSGPFADDAAYAGAIARERSGARAADELVALAARTEPGRTGRTPSALVALAPEAVLRELVRRTRSGAPVTSQADQIRVALDGDGATLARAALRARALADLTPSERTARAADPARAAAAPSRAEVAPPDTSHRPAVPATSAAAPPPSRTRWAPLLGAVLAIAVVVGLARRRHPAADRR